ncbi:MAG TPA: BatA domain-containing protein, partial [Pyrinomonadaceae bacterium]
MSFLNPLALIGLALVGLPILVHLLARRWAGRLDFPTLRYLRETPSFRLRPRRIQEPWLLALRVLAIMLLVLGIASPFFTARTHGGDLRLILLDASLSMHAKGRAEAAREQARAIIKGLPQGERAALLTFSSTASVLMDVTADRQELLAAIEKYEPENGAADFQKSFAAAAAVIERAAPGTVEIDLISDFQRANLAQLARESTPPPARTIAHAVGSTIERNAFLLDEEILKNEGGIEISAAEIVSSADGQSGARRSWTLDQSTGERPDINWQTQTNGQLTGHLSTLAPDDFDADDERFFACTPPRAARVLLIESDAETNLFAGAALEAA